VVDDFLKDPDAIRDLALQQEFVKMHSARVRTEGHFVHLAPYREDLPDCSAVSRSIGTITQPTAGFSVVSLSTPFPIADNQSAAGVLFLKPDAPIDAGLSRFAGGG
jgi:hypothetical protein